MNTRHIYSIAIGLLVVCTLIIIGKLLFISPCVPTSAKDPTCSYIIDGWSVAGLAATVMGVAATLLAILGAVAVAAWWANLEERVDKKVDEKVDALFQERSESINKLINQKQAEVLALQNKLVQDSENTSTAIASLVLGDQLWHQKKSDQALLLYQKAHLLRPQDPQINYTLGHTYNELGRYKEAIECLKVAVQEEPKFGQAYTQLALATRLQADALYKNSNDQEARDETYVEVIHLLKLAIGFLPNDEEPLATLGGTYRRQEKYKLSLKYYQEALVASPQSSYALGNIANLAYYEGEMTLAYSTYPRVEALATKRIDGALSNERYWDYFDRGMARLIQGQKAAALDDYQHAILQNPTPGALQSAIDGLEFLTDGKAKQSIHGLNDVLQLLANALKDGTLEKVR